MNSLNLKFVPKKTKKAIKTSTNSILLGGILGLAVITVMFMIGFYDAKAARNTIADLKPKHDELYELISKPGYDISLNDSVLTINSSHYDLGKINIELNALTNVDGIKYYYTKVGNTLVFYTSVTITVDTLEQAATVKTNLAKLNWVNKVTEQDEFKFENNKYTVSYLLALKMGELTYEKN